MTPIRIPIDATPLEREFLEAISSFMIDHEISWPTFGLWALNQSGFCYQLDRGQRCRLDTAGKVLEKLDLLAAGRIAPPKKPANAPRPAA